MPRHDGYEPTGIIDTNTYRERINIIENGEVIDQQWSDESRSEAEITRMLGLKINESSKTFTIAAWVSSLLFTAGSTLLVSTYYPPVENFMGAGDTRRPARATSVVSSPSAEPQASEQPDPQLKTPPAVTPSSTPSESISPSQSPSVDDPLTCTAKLPLETRVAQGLIMPTDAKTIDTSSTSFNEAMIGGTVVNMPDSQEPDDTQLANFKALQTIPPFITTFGDDGTVQRLASSEALPSTQVVDTADNTPDARIAAIVSVWKAGVDVAVVPASPQLNPQELVDNASEQLEKAIKNNEINETAFNESKLRIFNAKGVNPCEITTQPAPAQN